jgi:glycine cleavage system H lipoate-binding protein
MIPHDLLTMYSTKAMEYLIAVAFLLLFVPFWRFVNAERVAERVGAVELPRWLGQVVEWFLVPDTVHFHPGHAWARVGDGGLVTIGMDDFAHKLVGGVSTIRLPEVGARLGQGEKAWSLVSDGKSVDMLSPVDGVVVAVNGEAVVSPEKLHLDPYGEGWLLRVRAPRLTANLKQLLSGTFAKRWMEEVCDNLRARMSPDLGRVYQDGGVPIHGMARSLDPARWDEVVRSFLLTSGGR